MFYQVFLDAVCYFRCVANRLVKFLVEVPLDPVMAKQFLDARALFLVPIEALHDKVLGLAADVTPVIRRRVGESHILVADIEVNLLDAS